MQDDSYVPPANRIARGAYGLKIEGVDPPHDLLTPAPDSWSTWTFNWEECQCQDGYGHPEEELWDDQRAVLDSFPHGHVEVDRATSTTTFFHRSALSPEAIVHPYLAATAVISNNWMGRPNLHAGAFVVDGNVWGILGDKNMGKSSSLLWLHLAGFTVFTDDVLILDNGKALCGPRCLDLRESCAQHFETGEFMGMVGARERWRVRLGPCRPELPFAGWVVLHWGDSISVSVPKAADRLGHLASSRGVHSTEAGMPGLLDIVSYPMLVLSRPKDWDRLDAAMESLVSKIASGDH